MIVMLGSAVGRAGEVKFQCFDDWRFDPWLQVTDIGWRERKTLMKHGMHMVPDIIYLVCFYHAIVCYFALEDCIYRSDEMVDRD